MKRSGTVIWIMLLVFAFAKGAGSGDVSGGAAQSVVKVFSSTVSPDYSRPWQTGDRSDLAGTGVVISGDRILTNAHIVANSIFVRVKKQGDPETRQAEVLFAGHDCDLALLGVKDAEFFKDLKPLETGRMPKPRDKIDVYCFPVSSERVYKTDGVVSGIETGVYKHSQSSLLMARIDAAVSQGSSGGPVLRNGRLAGLVFQGFSNKENMGYIVPAPVISHFLEDIKDGVYDGFPGWGMRYQFLENPDYRRFLGMKHGQTGVVVKNVSYNSTCWGKLSEGDVILSVDGRKVANNGTVAFEDGQRIELSGMLFDRFPGDSVSMKILRDGRKMDIILTLASPRPLVPFCEYDVMPDYYIFGGLVFSPLTYNYLSSWSPDWWEQPLRLRFHYQMDHASPEKEQLVIMQYVLADEANLGYQHYFNQVVQQVNGQNVRSLEDLVHKIETCSDEFINIEMEGDNRIVISMQSAKQANKRILKRYRIPSDRSSGLE